MRSKVRESWPGPIRNRTDRRARTPWLRSKSDTKEDGIRAPPAPPYGGSSHSAQTVFGGILGNVFAFQSDRAHTQQYFFGTRMRKMRKSGTFSGTNDMKTRKNERVLMARSLLENKGLRLPGRSFARGKGVPLVGAKWDQAGPTSAGSPSSRFQPQNQLLAQSEIVKGAERSGTRFTVALLPPPDCTKGWGIRLLPNKHPGRPHHPAEDLRIVGPGCRLR